MFALGIVAILSLSSPYTVSRYRLSSEQAPEQVVANDNRRPAGTIVGRTMSLHLEIRRGAWHPDRAEGPGITVNAFAEEGKPLSVPGPLIRVPAGAIVRVTVRNTLFNSVVVYGLSARGAGTPRSEDTVQIRPGAVQEVSFPAGAAGTYYYWAKSARDTSSADPLSRAPVDAILGGAFVIDPRGSAPSDKDRVFVLNFWDPMARSFDSSATAAGEPSYWFTINGNAWPSTEAVSLSRGDTIRMRFVNMTLASGPMQIEVPLNPAVVASAVRHLEGGSTYVLELTPQRSGDLSILLKSANGTLLGRLTVQVHLRGSAA